MSDIKMSDSEDKIKEIFRRVEIAANGQISTASWCESDVNLSAPDGMDYWDWIEQAVNESIFANSVLVAQNLALKAALEKVLEISGGSNEQNMANFDDELASQHNDDINEIYKLVKALEGVGDE